jgi:hypothetical protein
MELILFNRKQEVLTLFRAQREFLLAQGWDKYPDRFFTRCYVQDNAYEEAAKAQQKHVDQSSSS